MSSGASPDERVFRVHLDGARFQEGVDSGRWRLVQEVDWPIALIAVSAAPRTGAPEEFVLRFDLSGYPTDAPTATPWDLETGAKLPAERRPKGERVGLLFRVDWEEGRALYAPYDRIGLTGGHAESWKDRRELWDSSKDITFVLRNVHHLLNADDYTGI